MAVYESGAGELGRGITLDNGHILRVFAGGTIVIFSLRDIDEERFGSVTSTIEAISFAAANDTAPGATRQTRPPALDGPANELPLEGHPFEFTTPDCFAGASFLVDPWCTDVAPPSVIADDSPQGGAWLEFSLNCGSAPEPEVSRTAGHSVTVRCDGVDFVFCANPGDDAALDGSSSVISLNDGTTITVMNAPMPHRAPQGTRTR